MKKREIIEFNLLDRLAKEIAFLKEREDVVRVVSGIFESRKLSIDDRILLMDVIFKVYEYGKEDRLEEIQLEKGFSIKLIIEQD